MSGLNVDHHSPRSRGIAAEQAGEPAISANQLDTSDEAKQLKELMSLARKTYDKGQDAYYLVTRNLKQKVWNLLDLDRHERCGKSAGRVRFRAPLELIKREMDHIALDQSKTRLAILEALKQYARKTGDQTVATEIGELFKEEFISLSAEHPYSDAELAAESLANIHRYPRGPIGRTNAQLFEAQISECIDHDMMTDLGSEALEADREAAQERRTTLMKARGSSEKDQANAQQEVIKTIEDKITELKSLEGAFNPDTHTVSWHGCMRANPMSHAYIATFHTVGDRVFMKVSDSGDLGLGLMQTEKQEGDVVSMVSPTIFEISNTESVEFRQLLEEMASSTVTLNGSIESRAKTLKEKILAASEENPDLPPEMITLRQQGMRKMEGDYCVSWSHMHDRQTRLAMRSEQRLGDDTAKDLFTKMQMLVYRNKVDERLMEKAGHAATKTLRDIATSAQYSMADEARKVLAQWRALPEAAREAKAGFSDYVKRMETRLDNFQAKYNLTVTEVKNKQLGITHYKVSRPETKGAENNSGPLPDAQPRIDAVLPAHIFRPPVPPQVGG